MKLFRLDLEIDSIIIGERFKGGAFRPCQDTIPSSSIEGALKHYFGIDLPAVGFFEEGTYKFDEFVYSVKDKYLQISKMPLISACLKPKTEGMKIKASIFIPYNKDIPFKNMLNAEFQLGALKSKGFGKAKIIKIEEIESEIKQGILKVKLFEEEAKEFGIKIISPLYGYLFKPDSFSIGGRYKRALFPGSLVNAPKVFLLSEVTYYDE